MQITNITTYHSQQGIRQVSTSAQDRPLSALDVQLPTFGETQNQPQKIKQANNTKNLNNNNETTYAHTHTHTHTNKY